MQARSLAAVLVLLSSTAFAGNSRAEGIDVPRWLDRPGVRMLAVEFFATWCKPCVAAMPAWKALQEKYAAAGLRLVVIATQDPAGCANLGASPDELICDEEGTIARAFGAEGALPAAFLWSWDGRLLVKKGGVDDVRKAVEEWIARAPRVDVSAEVDASAQIEQSALRDLVRARLEDAGKLKVVADAAEQARLDALKLESLKARYDERAQCEIGRELPANGLVQARISGRKGASRFSLSLLSAETGCLVAASVSEWRPEQMSQIVAEAVAELVQKLRSDIAAPTSGNLQSRREVIVDATPKIVIRSAGLSDQTIEAEKLVLLAPEDTHRRSLSRSFRTHREIPSRTSRTPQTSSAVIRGVDADQ